MTFSHALSLLFYTTLASATCTRPNLQSTLDTFFQSAFSRASNKNPTATSLTYSPTLHVSQNNQNLQSPALSAYANITSFYKPFRVTSIDTEICTIASFVLINERDAVTGRDVPAMMSVRIKTEDDGKAVKELEVLNVLKGSHAFFKPESFPNEAPAMWSTPQNGNVLRTELLRIANLYPSGIQAGDGSAIPAGTTCPRVENGVQTTTNCNKNLDRFKQPVRDRRWVADTQTGVVLGGFYFDKPKQFNYKYGLWLNEYFKIDGGKMVGIQACMKELQGVPFVDVWGAGGAAVNANGGSR